MVEFSCDTRSKIFKIEKKWIIFFIAFKSIRTLFYVKLVSVPLSYDFSKPDVGNYQTNFRQRYNESIYFLTSTQRNLWLDANNNFEWTVSWFVFFFPLKNSFRINNFFLVIFFHTAGTVTNLSDIRRCDISANKTTLHRSLTFLR